MKGGYLVKSDHSPSDACRGTPHLIRCGNGLENVSGAITHWAEKFRIQFKLMQRGKLRQNAHVERFNQALKYECLSRHLSEWIWKIPSQPPTLGLGRNQPFAATS